MFVHREVQRLDDLFQRLSVRGGRDVYFYRITSYTEETDHFLKKYFEAARRCGVLIEGKILNPTESQLSFFSEMMGMEFEMTQEFLAERLGKWLPRMDRIQRQNVAESMYDRFLSMRREGKNDNILKNAYIKFMCWLYYKFERIVNLLGQEEIPKIFYDGEIGNYELMLLKVLSNAGCDVVLLETAGDLNYRRLDPNSLFSMEWKVANGKAFPKGYSIRYIREQLREEMELSKIYGRMPERIHCTNAWISGKAFEDIRAPASMRGTDTRFFYNCFIRMNGVEDKLLYSNELFRLSQDLKQSRRRLVVIEDRIPRPENEEISSIQRGTYTDKKNMLMELKRNIVFALDMEMQRLMNWAFVDVMLSERKDEAIHKSMNKAVYLLCWLKRYQSKLFSGGEKGEMACFIHLGGCKDEYEALFLKLLTRLPVDVLILKPDRNEGCVLNDPFLYEENYSESMKVSKFPDSRVGTRIGTAAFHAERDLDTVLYENTGIYRNQQYHRAEIINLQTIYEEIQILWNTEMKYRPSFEVRDETVYMPVIYAKVSGVKHGKTAEYWKTIKDLAKEDAFLIREAPFFNSVEKRNPMMAYAPAFLKNGRLNRAKIKEHPAYTYGFLREEVQDHILEKLQLLIDQRLIKGTFENGTEYTIVATILNLPKEILRLLQRFDFTKKNPKLIYINTGEKRISLEDTILTSFLNLAGFDVVFFIPTGYQSVEGFLNNRTMEEYQMGEYLYDLSVSEMDHVTEAANFTLWSDIFRRRKN